MEDNPPGTVNGEGGTEGGAKENNDLDHDRVEDATTVMCQEVRDGSVMSQASESEVDERSSPNQAQPPPSSIWNFFSKLSKGQSVEELEEVENMEKKGTDERAQECPDVDSHFDEVPIGQGVDGLQDSTDRAAHEEQQDAPDEQHEPEGEAESQWHVWWGQARYPTYLGEEAETEGHEERAWRRLWSRQPAKIKEPPPAAKDLDGRVETEAGKKSDFGWWWSRHSGSKGKERKEELPAKSNWTSAHWWRNEKSSQPSKGFSLFGSKPAAAASAAGRRRSRWEGMGKGSSSSAASRVNWLGRSGPEPTPTPRWWRGAGEGGDRRGAWWSPRRRGGQRRNAMLFAPADPRGVEAWWAVSKGGKTTSLF